MFADTATVDEPLRLRSAFFFVTTTELDEPSVSHSASLRRLSRCCTRLLGACFDAKRVAGLDDLRVRCSLLDSSLDDASEALSSLVGGGDGGALGGGRERLLDPRTVIATSVDVCGFDMAAFIAVVLSRTGALVRSGSTARTRLWVFVDGAASDSTIATTTLLLVVCGTVFVVMSCRGFFAGMANDDVWDGAGITDRGRRVVEASASACGASIDAFEHASMLTAPV